MAAARILLADDDRELSELLTRFLVREGFSVEPVFDGEAVLRRALSEPYDALVLDIMMPVRSGLDVLRDLRAATTLPVLMLTALGDDVDRILGLEIGADDYLTKPCNPHELAARIRAVLRRARRD
ncbi:transcriptional regulatory protein CpxR, partial [mine drainage metagenome]